ncbi:hypothetical protein ACFVFI_28435 [Streptomyces sp. NPDC057705]|uniref:hypothetical protein n=1 Tax=Streptomyces sp. NPDC057705 TaxID=3346222 RepID=UPI00369F983A
MTQRLGPDSLPAGIEPKEVERREVREVHGSVDVIIGCGGQALLRDLDGLLQIPRPRTPPEPDR